MSDVCAHPLGEPCGVQAKRHQPGRLKGAFEKVLVTLGGAWWPMVEPAQIAGLAQERDLISLRSERRFPRGSVAEHRRLFADDAGDVPAYESPEPGPVAFLEGGADDDLSLV